MIEPVEWDPSCPVEFIKGAILFDTTTDNAILQLKLCNNSDNCIKSVHLSIKCFDETGEAVAEDNKFEFAYQDLQQASHTVFGEKQPIFLPDKRVRKVNIHFNKVMFSDGSIIKISNEGYPIPNRETISEFPNNLITELHRIYEENLSFPSKYIPNEYDNKFWLCTCGKMNVIEDSRCVRCVRDYNAQIEIINQEYLQKSYDQYQHEIEIQKDEAEQKLIVENQQNKELIQNKRKAIKRKLSFLLIFITIIGVALYSFFGFGLPAIKFSSANQLLSKGDYASAKACFKDLGDYNNSKELIKECDYQQALYYKNHGDYQKAIDVFVKLESYKDNKQLILETKYLYAISLLKENSCEKSLILFTELNNYKDSQQQIIECKYINAKEYMENKSFDKAVSIFSELGGYKNSKDLMIECNYQSALAICNQALSYNDIFMIKSSAETLSKLGNYKNSKSKMTEIQNALKWTGEWVIIKEVKYSNGKTETNTYGPYCNNEFLSKDSFPTINIAYMDQKINDGFSSIQPDTAFTEKNNSLTFTGFGQIKYVLTKESDKILIVKGYYYDGSPAYVYKAIRKEDINNIQP